LNKWISQLIDFLKPRSSSSPNTETSAIREAIEAGQRAKRAEDDAQALEIFNRALTLAENAHDQSAAAVIHLHTAEVYTHLQQYPQAEDLLNQIRRDAQNAGQRMQLAYALNGLGMLAQAQGDETQARVYYEQARETARSADATGPEGRALGHLADTYLAEGNASYAVHLLREALPKLNGSGDIELSSYFVGRLGQALIATGQEAEGQQLLIRALRLAEQMRHRAYERLWALALAERAMMEQRYSDAYTRYKQGLRLFRNHTPDYVNALCRISRVCLNLQEESEALEYAERAVEVSEQLQDADLKSQAQGALGMALRAAGRSADAIAPLLTAAEAYEHKTARENLSAQVELLRSLAAAQAEIADAEAAASTYRRALETAKKLGQGLDLAQVYRDFGLFYAERQDMQSAIEQWSAALAIYEQAKQHAHVARLYCDIAGARKFLGQGQRAMRDYEQALMALNTVDDWMTRGIVLSNAANAYADHGEIESADSFFNESISIARRMGDLRAEATRRGNYGWFLLSTGRPQQAISSLENALRMSRQLGLDLQAAVQTDNLGLAHDLLHDYPAALRCHEQALSLAQQLKNPHWEAIFKINLANTLLELRESDKAAEIFEETLAQGRLNKDTEVIVRSLTGLGRVALAQDQAASADAALQEAITLARRADMRRFLADGLRVQSQQQAALDQPEKSSALWEEAQKLFKMLHTPEGKMRPAWLKEK
jgi:tetratricopeptide (TPR) repeat protein